MLHGFTNNKTQYFIIKKLTAFKWCLNTLNELPKEISKITFNNNNNNSETYTFTLFTF
jgi:hypothetical protein